MPDKNKLLIILRNPMNRVAILVIFYLHHQQASDQNLSESTITYYFPQHTPTYHNRTLSIDLVPSLVLLNTGKHFSKNRFKSLDQAPPALNLSPLKYILMRILYLLVAICLEKTLCS